MIVQSLEGVEKAREIKDGEEAKVPSEEPVVEQSAPKIKSTPMPMQLTKKKEPTNGNASISQSTVAK